ncbi:MAG: hypothetical protein ACK47B_11960 [Armatimonadota bacterium]
MLPSWPPWIADNAFLLRDLARRSRKGLPWRLPLWAVGLPALVFAAVLLAERQWGPDYFGKLPLGAALLYGVSLAHVAVRLWNGPAPFSLADEAEAGRTEFLRLIPLTGRELVRQITAARAAARLLPALGTVPLYLLCLAYGGVQPRDVATILLLHLLPLWAPPSAEQLPVHPVGAKQDEDEEGERETEDASEASPREPSTRWSRPEAFRRPYGAGDLASEAGCMGGCALALGILVALGISGVVRLPFRPVFEVLISVVPRELFPLLPFGVMVAVARLLWEPLPFFHLSLPPALPLLAWIVLSRTAVAREAAFAWDRSTFDFSGDSPTERRIRRDRSLRGALLLLLLGGYYWRGVAAKLGEGPLLLLVAAGAAFVLFRRWREARGAASPESQTPAIAPDEKPSAPEAAAQEVTDRLEQRLLGYARRVDNPLLTRSLRQVTRHLHSPLVRLLVAPVLGFVMSLGFTLPLLVAYLISQPQDLSRWLSSPGGDPASVALGVSGGVLAIGGLVSVVSFWNAVHEGYRPSDTGYDHVIALLLTPLEDARLVEGYLSLGLVQAAITSSGALGASAVWLLGALALGVPWWIALVWLWGTVTLALLVAHGALQEFEIWTLRPRRRALLLAIGAAVLLVVILAAVWDQRPGLFPMAFLLTLLLLPVYLAARLPASYRAAIRFMRQARRPESLEKRL